MNTEKTFNENAKITSKAIFALAAFAMIGFSIYLTSHYFEVMFPTGLAGASLCDLNSFFNCDVATMSPLSNIAGIPISVFGVLAGVFLLAGYIFKSREVESTNHFLLIINFVGCIVLFLYSLIALGGLCPFCTMYYIASGVALFIFWKNSSVKTPDIKILAIYAIVTVILAAIVFNSVGNKKEGQKSLAADLTKQYYALANLGNPTPETIFWMAKSTDNFEDAPIRITKFSDFQCPACKTLSNNLHKAIKKYEGKINIQYMFYPLDANCNPSVQRQLHDYACKAAYLTYCKPAKFAQLEKEIFANQSSLSHSWLDKVAAREGITECMNADETKKQVTDYIAQSAPFNVKSTPTFLLNGVKIEGVLPLAQLYILFDEILKRSK